MKKAFLLFAFVVSVFISRAFWDVLFCTNTDSLGNCKGRGETFVRNGDKTPLHFIVMNTEKLGLDKLRYMVFNMETDKQGKLYADLSQKVNAESLYTVKKIYFYKPGYYKVDVLDTANNFLTMGFVTISEREQ